MPKQEIQPGKLYHFEYEGAVFVAICQRDARGVLALGPVVPEGMTAHDLPTLWELPEVHRMVRADGGAILKPNMQEVVDEAAAAIRSHDTVLIEVVPD